MFSTLENYYIFLYYRKGDSVGQGSSYAGPAHVALLISTHHSSEFWVLNTLLSILKSWKINEET